MADQIRAGSARLQEAGWNVAQAIIDGITNGLKSLVGRAASAAASAAKTVLNAAMGVLGIHSPSTEFHWIGEMAVLGMANGLSDYSHVAANSAAEVGENAIDAMSKTLSGLSKVLGSDLIDFNPTITPVLDLTQVRSDAASISDMLNLSDFDIVSALNNAKNAGVGFETNRTDDGIDEVVELGSNYTFNQTNTSPKALSDVEIYRQTNNLISRTKGANGA